MDLIIKEKASRNGMMLDRICDWLRGLRIDARMTLMNTHV